MDKEKTPEIPSPPQIPSVMDSLGRQLFSSPMDPDIVSEEVPLNIFEDDPEPIPEVKPKPVQQVVSEFTQEAISELAPEAVSELTPEAVSELTQEALNELTQEALSELTQDALTELTQEALFDNELTLQSEDDFIPEIEILPVIQPETSPLLLNESEVQDLPEEVPITEPLPAIEITIPEPVSDSTPEPILETLPEVVGEDEPSPQGLISSSSNSDILNESTFGEAQYSIPNKCSKLCSFEYQVHPEPSTSRTSTPKVVFKRRCTRKVTREEEIKKENYRKFQEEMDKIEVVKDGQTEKKKRVSKSPPKIKARKITKKAPMKPKKKQPEPKKRNEPPKRINKRKQANPKKISQ